MSILACKCKVKRCPICSAFSRCGCNHDGKAIEYKTKRGAHRPRIEKRVISPRNKLTEANNTYNDDIIDTDDTEYDDGKYIFSPDTTDMSKSEKIPLSSSNKSIHLLHNMFGIPYTSRSNFPSAVERKSVECFEKVDSSFKYRILSLITSMLEVICSICIPNDTEGLLHAIGLFILKK